MIAGQKQVPEGIYILIFAYLSYCLLFTPNFLITVPVILYPAFAFRLLWIDGQSNVLFWGMILQWLNSATQLLHCNFLRITLEERTLKSSFPAYTMNDAVLYSIVGLYFFSFGVHLLVKKVKHHPIQDILWMYDAKKTLSFYIVFSIVTILVSGIIWRFPTLVQYFYFFLYIKWGFFLVTFYIVHKKGSLLKSTFYSFITFEVLLSLTSFFAGNFINIISYIILGSIILKPRLTVKSYLTLFLAGVLLFHIFVLWSAVKNEYRAYVTKGQVTQSIVISREEANAKLKELITNVDEVKYQDGVTAFVDRLGYVQYFAATIDYVPKVVPHQYGQIYWSAIEHYLVPRFLNPNKEILDDTKHTSRYTGITLSGRESATSFSLGYIADAYIDFGPYFMHAILFFFGCLFGLFYKNLYTTSKNVLWSWVFTAPFFLLININGADTKKALGWILIYFLVMKLTQSTLYKRLDPFLRG